jgi:hypothetical protein
MYFGCFQSSFGQRLSSGFTFNFPMASHLKFEQNYYSPASLFSIYMVNDPSETNPKYRRTSLLGFGKRYAYSGLGIGYLLKIDYRRYAIRFGYRFSFIHSKIQLNQLNDNSTSSSNLDEYPAEFYMESFYHKFPLFFTVDLKPKNNSPYIVAGVELGYMFAKIEKVDWDFSLLNDRLKTPYLYGHYYNHEPFVNAQFGIGIKRKRLEWLLCYKTRVDSNKVALTIKENTIDINMNIFISQKSLRANHYLFIDE